ncbi:MAG: histidinol phosphate phosphatase [Geminicoccaceae bacterium]|nr:histidinol phosphate phosphatase [Geminicoccaceae bacterium]MCS7268672.1 histidinol phosphate phosphatase [Geminicoccaceae bacterium]MCX7629559.1 histidinol phosphate phosphatase [Geminicoccaceae bacterium]MDW8125193.1 inositol monophosphatase family protein [Geminicoccaceae bacterium]MDW8341479.1 inositol monophosphatase family protein [Geminicoccaceae bacterium]
MDRVPSELVAFAHRLADAAGEIQRRWFRRPVAVDTKPDASPVTIADREAEAIMRELVARHRPEDGILGEEHGRERLDAEWVWVFDPIDGTKSFLAGRPLFVTLVGLLREGRPVLGLVDQAIAGERWLGVAGRPTLFNGRPCRCRPCAELDAAFLACTSPQMFRRDEERAAFARLLARVRQAIWGGDAYGSGLLALGFLDLVVEADLEPYDVLPLVPVIEGAGGRVSDWQGRAPGLASDQRMVAAGDPRLHARALSVLAGR